MLTRQNDCFHTYTANIECKNLSVANVVIESPTRCGKTTLVNELLTRPEFSNSVSHHFAFPKGETNLEKTYYQLGQFELCMDFISKMNKLGVSVILDRSWIGELVWGPKYRQYDPIEMIKKLENEYLPKMSKTLLVRLVCPYETILERRKQTKDIRPFMTNEEWTDLNMLFHDAVEESQMKHKVYHTEICTAEIIADSIIEDLKYER